MVIGWWNVILIGRSNSMTVPLRTPSGPLAYRPASTWPSPCSPASMARSLRR